MKDSKKTLNFPCVATSGDN